MGWLVCLTLAVLLMVGIGTVFGTGDMLAFVSERTGNNEVYLMDIGRTLIINLTRHPDQDSDPSWSPDGQRLLFVSDRRSTLSINSNLYVMDADGSNVQRLTQYVDRFVVNPRWSPDNTELIYYAYFNTDLYIHRIILSDGRVTSLSEAQLPDWYRAGESDVYVAAVNGNQDIYRLLPDGTVQRLTSHPAPDFAPVLRPTIPPG